MTEASTQGGTLRLAAMATGSRFAAFNDHQGDDAARGKCAWGLRRLPHGHPGHVGVHDEPQGISSVHGCAALQTCVPLLPVLNWRGLRSASFSRISHWPFPSLAADRRVLCSSRSIRRNSPARAVTGCAGAFHSVRFSDCRPSRTNTLAHQLPINRLADRPHVQVLSKASLRPTHIGRSEKEWRYLISVMRCPK